MNKLLSIFKDFPEDFVFGDYEWQFKELIGEGGFGKIYKVRNKQTNQYDAIKQLDMKLFDQEFKLEALRSQIKIMDTLKSENIVQIKDFFEGKRFTYLVLELCDSDLKKELAQKGGKLPETHCAEIFHQISKGFQKMVKKSYMHRDIKPENILVKKGVYKVADFGFTRKFKAKKEKSLKQVCGTPLYMAPQMLFEEFYTEKCDLWSLGLMLYEMIYGFSPWPTKHPEVYKNSIKTKPIAFPYNSKIGQNTYDILKKCLQVEQKNRIGWKQFFDHPFVKQKNPGPQLKFPKIDLKYQQVLRNVQESVQRRNIDILHYLKSLMDKYGHKELNKKQFMLLLRDMDPTMTTYEAEQLFLITDANQSQTVSLDQFREIFCNFDYRPAADIASRRIQQIIAMAQAQSIKLRKFFSMFDTDNSNSIDKNQFYHMINKIAPQINEYQIQQMWDRFDSDRSGEIEADEFIAEMTRNAPNQASKIGMDYQRGKRNIVCFWSFLKNNKIPLKDFFRQADKDLDNKLSMEEFGTVIQTFNYNITKEEIVEMFQLFDNNQNGFLQLAEIEEKFKYVPKTF